MKPLKFVILFFALIFEVNASGKQEYSSSELVEFVQEVRVYFHKGTGSCLPQYSFDDRMDLVEEFLTIKDHEVNGALFQESDRLSIFLERREPYRPGLSLDIVLYQGKCKKFYIYEIMN